MRPVQYVQRRSALLRRWIDYSWQRFPWKWSIATGIGGGMAFRGDWGAAFLAFDALFISIVFYGLGRDHGGAEQQPQVSDTSTQTAPPSTIDHPTPQEPTRA